MTLKVRDDVPSLRAPAFVGEIERTFAEACERGNARLVHYSIQSNHAHLIAEAIDTRALARLMMSIAARFSHAVNRVFARRGPVLADHYHVHVLRTPREVRNALRCVLLNPARHRRRPSLLDPASSARWFDGWRGRPRAVCEKKPPVSRARSWLLVRGWRRHGLLDPSEVPG